MMSRKQCEDALMAKFKEMVEIYKQYNPNCTYLSASRTDDGTMFINNRYYEPDSPDYEKCIRVSCEEA